MCDRVINGAPVLTQVNRAASWRSFNGD